MRRFFLSELYSGNFFGNNSIRKKNSSKTVSKKVVFRKNGLQKIGFWKITFGKMSQNLFRNVIHTLNFKVPKGVSACVGKFTKESKFSTLNHTICSYHIFWGGEKEGGNYDVQTNIMSSRKAPRKKIKKKMKFWCFFFVYFFSAILINYCS